MPAADNRGFGIRNFPIWFLLPLFFVHFLASFACSMPLGTIDKQRKYSKIKEALMGAGIENAAMEARLLLERFSGKELSAETGLYDFSARFLHPRSGRFTTLDPLAEKYPSISPYSYCMGNPANFVDPDGRDFRRIIRRNTITIEASYYVKNHDAISYESASRAVAFWNNRQDIYIAPSGKKYTVSYNLTVDYIKPKEFNPYIVKKDKDAYNTYMVVDSFNSSRSAGRTENKENIQILESYSKNRPGSDIPSTTGAHEIGHTLGMKHSEKGIMSESQNELRTDDVTQDNLQQMMMWEGAQENWLSRFFKQFGYE